MKRVIAAGALLAACHAAPPLAAGTAVRRGWTADSVYYEDGGAGPALVLLHAFSTDRRMWDAEAAHWRQRRRVITIDARGHGRTPMPRGAYRLHDDVIRVLDTLGVRGAQLVGLSSGARVALDAALAYPDRVVGLVLASPGLSGFVSRAPMPFMAPVLAAARNHDATGAARAWAATPLMAVADTAEAARLRAIVLDNAALWTISANPEVALSPPAIGRLGAVRVPTLVLVGSNDLAATREAAALAAGGIPGARLVEIAGAVHMLNFAAPGPFRRAVDAFLAR